MALGAHQPTRGATASSPVNRGPRPTDPSGFFNQLRTMKSALWIVSAEKGFISMETKLTPVLATILSK